MGIIKKIGKHETSYVIISEDEYESMKRTLDVLSDKELRRQLRESEKAIKEGKVRKFDDFVKDVKKK